MLNLIASDGIGALKCVENIIQACLSYGAYNILGNILLSFFPSGRYSFQAYTNLFSIELAVEDCMVLHNYYYYILLWLGWSLFSKVNVQYNQNDTDRLCEAEDPLVPKDTDKVGSNLVTNQKDLTIKTSNHHNNSNIGIEQVYGDTFTIEEIIFILSDVMMILLVESRVIYASCRFKLQQLEIAIRQENIAGIHSLEHVNKSMDESITITQNKETPDRIPGKIIGEVTSNESIDDNTTHSEAVKGTPSLDSLKEMDRLEDKEVNSLDLDAKSEKFIDNTLITPNTVSKIEGGSNTGELLVQNKDGKEPDGYDSACSEQIAKEPTRNEFDITADIKYFYPSVTLDYLRAEEQNTKEMLESVTKVLKV